MWPAIGRWAKKSRAWAKDETGASLVESLVAIAILGTAVVAALAGLSTGALAVRVANQEVTAQSLAVSQLEEIKSAAYAPTYSAISEPGYDMAVDVAPVGDNIQMITVAVFRDGQALISVQGYKVNR